MTGTTIDAEAAATYEDVVAAQVLDPGELARHVFRYGNGNRGRPWLQPGRVVAETPTGWWLVYGQEARSIAAQLATECASAYPPPPDQWRLATVEPSTSVVFTWHQPGCDGGADCHAGCFDGEGWWVNEVPPDTPGAVWVTPVAPVAYRPTWFGRLWRSLKSRRNIR